MASKSQKRLTRRQKLARMEALDQARGAEPIEAYKPKAGPGQIFKRVGDDDGNLKRLRNMGASPLLLAYHRGQLESGPKNRITAQDRFQCGEIFEKWWALMHSSGRRDSTDPGVGGGSGVHFSEAQQDAGRNIQRFRQRMGESNFRIVRAFCGDGHSMAESLRQAEIEAHAVGTAFRIREALDELVYAVTGLRASSQAVDKATKPG